MTFKSPDCGINPPSASPPPPVLPLQVTLAVAAAVVEVVPDDDGVLLLLPHAAATRANASATLTTATGLWLRAMVSPRLYQAPNVAPVWATSGDRLRARKF